MLCTGMFFCKTSDKNFASLDYFHISFALNIKFHKLCVLTLGSSELASSLSVSRTVTAAPVVSL